MRVEAFLRIAVVEQDSDKTVTTNIYDGMYEQMITQFEEDIMTLFNAGKDSFMIISTGGRVLYTGGELYIYMHFDFIYQEWYERFGSSMGCQWVALLCKALKDAIKNQSVFFEHTITRDYISVAYRCYNDCLKLSIAVK